MGGPFEELAGLDKLTHEPARLAILTALSACSEADFLFLQRLTGLSAGNLSSHLSKLEAAELIQIEKGYVARTPHTLVALTDRGREAIEGYWVQLEQLRERVHRWQPEQELTSGSG